MDQAAQIPDSGQQRVRVGWGWPLASAIIFSAAANLLMLTGPLFLLLVYERVIGAQSQATLIALVVLVAGLFAAMSVLDWARVRLISEMGAVLGSTIAARSDGSVRDLNVLTHLRQLTTGQTGLALLDLPWTPLFLLAIFALNSWLGWLALVGGTLVLSLGRAAHWIGQRAAIRSAPLDQELAALTHVAHTGGASLRAMVMNPATIARWQSAARAQSKGALMGAKATAPLIAAGRGTRMFLQSGMLAAGAALALTGEISAGAIFAATVLMGRALGPFEVLLPMVPQIASVAGSLIHPKAAPEPVTGALVGRQIVLNNVATRATPTLINLHIAAGEAVGICGPAGSGKSAFARVIAGAEAPKSGHIHPLITAQNGAFAPGQLGYAAQTPELMFGSIARIIARGAENPDHDAVRYATRLLGIDKAINALPAGYDTPLQAAASTIPSSLVRRIALARAFYGLPPLLVLDEPEQTLDSDGLDKLCAALAHHRRAGGTLILVSHHPTLLGGCYRTVQFGSEQIVTEYIAPPPRKAAS